MRRMITEKDVEKLDSVNPSEMQKLAEMQDPKTVKNGWVLTANGRGQAVYAKPASGGTRIVYRTTPFNAVIQQDARKGTFAEIEASFAEHIVSLHYTTLAVICGDIQIPYSEVQLLSIPLGTNSTITMLIPEATMTKYNLTVGSTITTNIGYCFYNE